MADMAVALGNHTAESRYTSLAEAARLAFHARFYNPSLEAYGGDAGAVQTLTTPALLVGSAPPSLVPQLVRTLEEDLARTNYTPRVGAVTSRILLNVLSENGLHEAALRAATTTQEPSWGHWWSQNATTCFEAWANAPMLPDQGTLNHVFLCGGIGHWMWKHLVGLVPSAPGFAQVTVAPKTDGNAGPRSVSGTFLSPRGAIYAAWALGNTSMQHDAVETSKGSSTVHETTNAVSMHSGTASRKYSGVSTKTKNVSTVSLDVTLPVGVQGGLVVVPKPWVHAGTGTLRPHCHGLLCLQPFLPCLLGCRVCVGGACSSTLK